MFGSSILDLAIGLIFVFLVVSLIVTAVSELIASWLKWRATNLEEGIRNLLQPSLRGDSSPQNFLLRAVNWIRNPIPDLAKPPAGEDAGSPALPKSGSQAVAGEAEDIVLKIYGHPLVNSLSRPGGRPSYIPSRTFALSLLDEVGILGKEIKTPQELKDLINAVPNENLKKSLLVLSEEAEHDLEKLKVNVEVWFNNAMDRVSGWYKRKTQVIHVILGIVFAFALNVDTFLIVKTIANDSALRDSLVAQAQELAKKSEPTVDSKKEIQERIKQLGGLGLPIGWTDQPVEGLREWPGWWPGSKTKSKADSDISWGALWLQTLKFHLVGWLLTGFAASLGAPFWFDTLNKFMNLRSVGKSPEEKPKAPKEVPKPREPGETV